jgi:acetolactate synthase small subunit
MPNWVVSALLQDDMLSLNRATGIIRRRNLPVSGVSLGPAGRPGSLRLTCVVTTDREAAERMANALRKMIEIREVAVHAEGACTSREHALVRVGVSPAVLSGLLDVVSLYHATVVEESPHDLLIEATGTAPFMVSFLRALEPFGVADLARRCTVMQPRQPIAEAVPAERTPVQLPKIATTILA